MIRPYATTDRDTVLDVWEASARVAHPFWTPDRFARERRAVADEFLPVAETWVFAHDGTVVGFIALLETEVGGLFVAPAYHRRGIGRALMDHARASRSVLELDVFEANAVGRAFYTRYGFRTVAERVDEDGQRVLRLSLAPGPT